MTEPTRWADDPAAPRALLDMIAAAKELRPTTDQKLALAGQLGLGSGIWSLPLIKWLAGSAIVFGGGFLLVPVTIGDPGAAHGVDAITVPDSGHRSAPHEEVDVPAPVSSERMSSAAATVAHPAAMTQAEPSKDVTTPSLVAVRKQIPGRTLAGSAQPTEAQLLTAARGAIGRDPDRALQFLAQHEALYPQGILGQEREVLRVRALRQAGEVSSAQHQAEEFRQKHPGSAHTTDP